MIEAKQRRIRNQLINRFIFLYHFSQQSLLQLPATIKVEIDKRLLSPIYVWLNFNFFHVSRQPPGLVKPLGPGGGDSFEVVLSYEMGTGQIDNNF